MGARPMSYREGGEPMFNFHDVQPQSSRGSQFLDDCHREAHRAERNERSHHTADAMRYSINHDHVMNFQDDVELNIGESRMRKQMSTQHMNETQALAVALLDNFTTVECYSTRSVRNLTFKKPKDLELEEGDMAICTFHDKGFDILEVKEVHDGVVNPDDIKLAWVVGKVDLEKMLHLQALDQKAVDKIKQMQQNKARKELLAEFDEDELKSLGEELEIKALPAK